MSDQKETADSQTSDELKFQLRLTLSDHYSGLIQRQQEDGELTRLKNTLSNHRAEMVCQYDAFSDYCAESEVRGEINTALYRWTKDTINDQSKKAKYLKIFTIYVGGESVYGSEIADRLERDLQPLASRRIIETISRYDNDPTSNPQPPKKYLS
ncbi:MAG: hypothetical protein OXC80_12100 [Gammaproteobacteria bacterium]|nr:hypothetical protein [Gammaproteobacteria bacterium]